MTKTIIIGWDNAGALGKPFLVSDVTVEAAKQIEIFDKAKRLHVYPKDCARLAWCKIEEFDTAILTDEKLSVKGAAIHAAEVEREKSIVAEKKRVAESAEALNKAESEFQSAVTARNALVGRESEIKNRIRNITVSSQAGLSNAAEAAEVVELKKELETLPPKIETAKATVEAKQKAVEDIKNPPKIETEIQKPKSKK